MDRYDLEEDKSVVVVQVLLRGHDRAHVFGGVDGEYVFLDGLYGYNIEGVQTIALTQLLGA